MEIGEQVRRRGPWVGLAVPGVLLAVGIVVGATCRVGTECLAPAVTAAALVFIATPTTVLALPLAGIAPGGVLTPVALGAITSLPLWWLAGRRVAHGVVQAEREDPRRVWLAFGLRWVALTLIWIAVASVLLVALASLVLRP